MTATMTTTMTSTMTSTITTILSIEGNIGSGKSTIIDYLKERYKNDKEFIFLPEPVDEWETIKDEENNTILQKFYADQKKI